MGWGQRGARTDRSGVPDRSGVEGRVVEDRWCVNWGRYIRR